MKNEKNYQTRNVAKEDRKIMAMQEPSYVDHL